MKFNKAEFAIFRKDVEEALEEVAKKHGITIESGKIKYQEYDFTMELKAKKVNEGADVQKEKFERLCSLYGFAPEQYKVEFVSNGKLFQLVGFNTNKPKNCCSLYCVTNGKTYQCNDELVKQALGQK